MPKNQDPFLGNNTNAVFVDSLLSRQEKGVLVEGTSPVHKAVFLTQAQYDALSEYDANVQYNIIE